MTGENNPPAAAIWALLGAASSMGFAAIGAAYGTAKAGNGIAMIAQRKPALMMKAIVPVVMAGKFSFFFNFQFFNFLIFYFSCFLIFHFHFEIFQLLKFKLENLKIFF